MSPRIPLLLNVLILIVNFVLVCVLAENDGRALRATARAAAAPIPMPVFRPEVRSAPPANRASRDAIGPIPHTRLLKFLARLDGAGDFSRPQREAVYDALAHCCAAMPRAAEGVRRSRGDPRLARERIEREVAARLRAAAFRDDAVARLVRVVVASAG